MRLGCRLANLETRYYISCCMQKLLVSIHGAANQHLEWNCLRSINTPVGAYAFQAVADVSKTRNIPILSHPMSSEMPSLCHKNSSLFDPGLRLICQDPVSDGNPPAYQSSYKHDKLIRMEHRYLKQSLTVWMQTMSMQTFMNF